MFIDITILSENFLGMFPLWYNKRFVFYGCSLLCKLQSNFQINFLVSVLNNRCLYDIFVHKQCWSFLWLMPLQVFVNLIMLLFNCELPLSYLWTFFLFFYCFDFFYIYKLAFCCYILATTYFMFAFAFMFKSFLL